MILIADSGATKTDWLLLNNSKILFQTQTVGFSPYYQETQDIIGILKTDLLPKLDIAMFSEIKQVYYYGTGCSSKDKNEIVSNALRAFFGSSEIHVNHDLLASARALCGKEPGIAAILGTGSNSCLYNGTDIEDNVPSLGIYLGDEGSGAHIGKSLIRAYLYRELPADIKINFDNTFHTNKDEILDAVYKKPFPNRYLGGFSKFVKQNIEHPFLKEMVTGCFHEFFFRHVLKYKDCRKYSFNCVGSIATNYKELLIEVCNKHTILPGRILSTPMEGLILYHSS